MKSIFTCGLLSAVLLGALGVSNAQAQMCKWEDENGTVHYAAECPQDKETKKVDLDSTQPVSDDPYATSRSQAQKAQQASSAPKKRSGGGNKSASQLAAECERARQARLKPERENLVRQCIAKGDKDAGYCQRYYANHGDGGRQGGRTVPRKYDNLPECVAARQAGG